VNTSYVGAHVGLGYRVKLTGASSLDLVTRGYWTRIFGKSVVVGPDHTVDFGATDAFHFRGGARYNYTVSPKAQIYLGGYYDREFNHDINGQSNGVDVGQADLKGASGIFEIGAVTRPSGSVPGFTLAFGLPGYVGKIEGFSGGFRVGYEF